MPRTHCEFCRQPKETRDGVLSRSSLCAECRGRHNADALRAICEVMKAVNRGELAPAQELMCTDCPKPASVHDHRDYLRPLSVEPVCRTCNMRRGRAFNSFYRPAGELELPPPIPKYADGRTTRHLRERAA